MDTKLKCNSDNKSRVAQLGELLEAKNEGLEQGLERGLRQGLEQGEERKEANIIWKLYDKGMKKSEISYMLDLDLGQVEKVIESEKDKD